ncbi:MAG: hypothetical protein U0800_21055 [Isosphaeraceae bacterium]
MSAGEPVPGGYYAAPRVRPAVAFDELGFPIKPGVVTWLKVYATAMGVLYFLMFVFMVLAWVGIQISDPDEFETQDRVVLGMVFPVLGLISAALAGVFLAPLALPRKPWVWVYGIVLIAIGLSNCALWPATIPLIIFWIRPEVRRYYGLAVAGN